MNVPEDSVEGSGRLGSAWRSFLALGIGNYGAMAVGLLVNVLLARRLGTEQYGRLALMLVASQVLLLASVNWSHVAFIRFGSREFASKGTITETLWTRLGIVLPAAGLGAIAIALLRYRLAAYLGIPPAGVWLILLHFAAICGVSIVGAAFQVRNQMARYGVCLFLDKTIMLVCVAALPATWVASPMVVLGCYAASSMSVTTWGLWVLGYQAVRPALPPRSVYREVALFSMPLLLTSWTGIFGTNWLDLVILKWYVPMSGIGVYSLAVQLAGVVQQITVIFSTLVLPHLSVMVAEGQHARIRTFMVRLLPYWLLGTSALFSLILIGSRPGLTLVFGPSFSGAAPVLALLMVGTSALAMCNACAPLVAAYGSTGILSGVFLAQAVVNVVLDLVLIPRLGVLGSALATVAAFGTSALLVLLLAQKRVGGSVLRLGWLGAPVLAAWVCFMLLDGLWFYTAAPIAAATCVVILIDRFRLFHTDDVVFLKELHLPMPFGLSPGFLLGKKL